MAMSLYVLKKKEMELLITQLRNDILLTLDKFTCQSLQWQKPMVAHSLCFLKKLVYVI